MGPLRDLSIANFSVILARFNKILKSENGDTHVDSVARWRDNGVTANDIMKVTRRQDDAPVRTHFEQMEYLTLGSPSLRHAYRLISKHCLTPDSVKGHKKIILGTDIPVTAWFAETVFRHAYMGVAVMHSNLSQAQRAALADQFNDEKSDLQVLILLADVSIVGLNLHRACNMAFVMTIFRNLALEIQLWGRVNRVMSHL